MSWGGLVGMALFAATPLVHIYLLDVQSATPAVSGETAVGFLLLIPLPLLATLTSWLRGVLIHRRETSAVNEAMVARLMVTALTLGVGLWWSLPGIATASAAVVLSSAGESHRRHSRLLALRAHLRSELQSAVGPR